MQNETVFLPDHSGLNVRHVALIAGGFFIFVQLFFLDTLPVRLIFTVVFAVFLLLGFGLTNRSARTWPQKIVVNRSGISSSGLKAQHGVDLIPWDQVARMDLFQSDPRLPPWLRIGLRPGAFCDRVTKSRSQHPGLGLDVNIPVSVHAAPEVVLETAQQFWQEAG